MVRDRVVESPYRRVFPVEDARVLTPKVRVVDCGEDNRLTEIGRITAHVVVRMVREKHESGRQWIVPRALRLFQALQLRGSPTEHLRLEHVAPLWRNVDIDEDHTVMICALP